MKERQKLLSYLRTRQLLQEQITKLKEEYLEACDTEPIYITDHSMVRYLERIKGLFLGSGSDLEKIKRYIRHSDYTFKQLRDEILTEREMRHIVANEVKRYEKGDCIYIIKNLSLVTIYKKEEYENKEADESRNKD